jgi:molybdopterin-synthase adenylyltransferase
LKATRDPSKEQGMRAPDGPVLVVGLGGLGCPASLALAGAGVRRFTFLDPDVVDVTNLHRQPWHHPADVGAAKVASAAARLRAAFPGAEVATRQERLSAANAEALFRGHAVVLDATDGVETKFLLSDAAALTRTPLVYAGVLRFEGLAMRIEPGGPCLRCLFETPPVDVPTCAQAGVLGSMAGLVGGLMARLALTPNPAPGLALLEVADGLAFTFRRVKVRRRLDCAACGEDATPVLSDQLLTPSCPAPASTSPLSSAR